MICASEVQLYILSAVACEGWRSVQRSWGLCLLQPISSTSLWISRQKITSGKLLVSSPFHSDHLAGTMLTIRLPNSSSLRIRAEISSRFSKEIFLKIRRDSGGCGGLVQNWSTFTGYIQNYYSGWFFFIPALLFLIAGIVSKKYRLNSILVLTWMVTYCAYFIFIAATLRPHYFLPVFLPLFASLGLFWSEENQLPFAETKLPF